MKIENRTRFIFQILINREEKENFFFKILNLEENEIYYSKSHKSRREREFF